MWLFTQYGFFSVVCGRDLDGNGGSLDPDTLMVRARSHKHLSSLMSRFPSLEGCEIVETPLTDYRYRIVVPKSTWAEVAKELAAEIDYGNFKSRAHECSGDSRYASALHDVWEVMEELQRP